MGDKQRGDKKGSAGLNFTKEMPNFLAVMTGGSGAAPDLGGIEGALQRHARKEDGEQDREDNEEEAPLVVDASEALTAKERRKLEAKPAGARAGGSLKFKGDESSSAAKFAESAFERVAAEEAQQVEAVERLRAAEAEAEAEAAMSGKAHLFKAGGASASAQQKLKGKRKHGGAEGGGAVAPPRPKAVKNAKLLSFDEDDE